MPIDLINDIFVKNNQKEFSRSSVRTDDIYHVGQFVKILPFDLFGQIECFHVVYEEMFVQIQLTKDQIKKYSFHDRIDRAADNAIYSTVILLKDSIAKCSENLEFLSESSLINKECIEYQILHPMEMFQKGDLIKAGKTGNVKYFIVNNRFIINGISCLSVMESILGEAEEYLPESDAMKVDNSELKMKYFQGVFIDPKSIRSFEKCENNDFCIGNRVEFMSMDLKSSYKGRIKSIGMANKMILSCVVQMPPSEPIVNRSLSQYTLNENLEFKILSGTANDFLFLIPANLLRKSELPETVNGIPVINPEFIRIIEGAAVEPAKFIVFTWNNERHSVQLKWKGLIDQKYCLGCVANFQWNFGTNGTFGQDKLFACEDKHGILIPLAAVSECCEIKGHKPIKWTRDGAIDENSICCTVEKNITKFQANCKLKNIKSNKKAIWKWSGLVNDVEVIGVEMNESLEKGTDGNFCKIQLFRSVHKRGALFKSEEFIISKSELKHVKEINLNVVDPFNVREIENGRQINKLACYKTKGAIKILNIKWRGIVNGELCVGCELSGPVEWGTDGTFGNKIVFKCPDRRGVLIPTEELIDSCETTAHLKIATLPNSGFWLWKGDTYFINPDCICCTESTESLQKHPDLRIKSRIKVPNKENKQIGGSCEWIGLINGQEALGITMDNDVKGTNGIFSCFRMFTCESGKGVLMLAENIVHDTQHEEFLSVEIENYELIIKMLLANEGDVNKLNTNQESIFDIANNLRNESFVNVMLDHCKQPLELSVTKSFEMILSNLVESENWDLLSQIIDHARVDEISNKYLMSLSISVLKKQKTTELFGKIMSLCLDKNIIFCGGETFVTALIKSGIHSSTMVSILARKLFDINKTNLGNETPLVLACEGLLLDVVKVLVALNCDLKRYRHEAIESAVLAKLKAKNENNHLKVDLGSQIIKLLSETIDNDSIQCNICMDRSIDTVLNCGHTFCLNCANEFHKCPNCNLDVSSYTKIFL